MAMTDRVRALTDQLLRRLSDEERTGRGMPGFTFEAADDGAIRDGEYGDPLRDTRPAWMKDEDAWDYGSA